MNILQNDALLKRCRKLDSMSNFFFHFIYSGINHSNNFEQHVKKWVKYSVRSSKLAKKMNFICFKILLNNLCCTIVVNITFISAVLINRFLWNWYPCKCFRETGLVNPIGTKKPKIDNFSRALSRAVSGSSLKNRGGG